MSRTRLSSIAAGLEDAALLLVVTALVPAAIILIGMPVAVVGWIAVLIARQW